MRICLVAVVLTGCSGHTDDPETSVLLPGSRAIVSSVNGCRVVDKARNRSIDLAAGVHVVVESDPGYFEITQQDIDADLREAEKYRDNALTDTEIAKREENVRRAKHDKPRKYHPPGYMSGLRLVRVKVGVGEHYGIIGQTDRRSLRPIPAPR